MVVLASVVLFVCVCGCVWSAGTTGEGAAEAIEKDWVRVMLALGGWVTDNGEICISKVYMMPQPPPGLLCLVNAIVWDGGVKQLRAAISAVWGAVVSASAFASFGLVLSCTSRGSYSLRDSLFVRLYTIIAFPCFVLQCAEMALKELLNPLSLPLRLFSLSCLVPYISLLPLFCP